MENKTSKKLVYGELSYRIIGQAMKVHSALGPGDLEKVYENALMKRLREAGIKAAQQAPIIVNFEDAQVGRYTADILVEGKIILELKACWAITKVFEAQALNYLTATRMKLAIIINFGRDDLQCRRVVNTKPGDEEY